MEIHLNIKKYNGVDLNNNQKAFVNGYCCDKLLEFTIKKQREIEIKKLSDKKLVWDAGISEWSFKFRKLNLVTLGISLVTVGFIIFDHFVTKPRQELKQRQEIEQQVKLYLSKIEVDKKHALEIPTKH